MANMILVIFAIRFLENTYWVFLGRKNVELYLSNFCDTFSEKHLISVFLENGIKVTKVDIRSDDRGKVTTGEKENTFENAEAD